MPEKKKQHYVSQFLLRNFSCEAGDGLINFYDRKSDRTQRQAVIKTQAQEKYFYGEDLTFENFLGNTEAEAAPVIREIFETGKLPPKEDIRYKRLLHFIMLYAFRTKAATEHTEDYLNAMMKEYAKHFAELGQIDWNQYRLSHPEPGAMNLAYHMNNWVVCADLEPLLLVNLTNKDFFISDDPLILYNPFMQSRKCYWNANSLMNKGLILLFPLSPKWYIMLYDPCIYDILVTRDLVVVDKSSDVYKINLLQSVYADRFVYFSDTLNERYVKNMALDGLKRKLNKYIHKKMPHPDTGRPALFSYHLPHKIEFYFSFIRDGQKARDYDVHSQLVQARSQELIDWVENQRPDFYNSQNFDNLPHLN